MIAIFDPKTRVLIPIMIYPKKAWEVPSDEDLRLCVANLGTALRQRELPGT